MKHILDRVRNVVSLLGVIILSLYGTDLSAQRCPPKEGPQEGGPGCGGIEGIPKLIHPYPWNVPVIQLRSFDPNDITGPKGYQTGQWMSVNDQLQYTVRFENDSKMATGPAQNVFVHIPVHPRMNGNTLKLGSFGFGQHNFTVPPNSTTFASRLDVRDSLGLYVDITAGLDVTRNEVFWTFKSIDPATGLALDDQARGFLPVNDSVSVDSVSGKGEGYVTFLLAPRKTLLTGDTVAEQASIVFDKNDPLLTNTWTNTIDAFPPVSHANSASIAGDTIFLRWSGTDDAGGVGVRDYALYVSEDGGPYKIHQKDLPDTSGIFVGTIGNTYRFFTVATDQVGNREPLKNSAELVVSLTGGGVNLPITWLYFEGHLQSEDALLTWAVAAEQHCRNYVVERSLDGKVFAEIGTVTAVGNTLQTANYQFNDPGAARLNVPRLFYRIRQVSMNNTSVYSRTISMPLRQDGLTAASVKAYPNPFTTQLFLKIVKVTQTTLDDRVEIYAMDGRLRYQRPLVLSGNTTVLLNDLPPLEPGNYLLKAVIDKQLFTIKMTRK